MNQQLQEFLIGLSPGPISDTAQLERLLMDAWYSLHGSGEGGMESYKVLGRVEAMCWRPPCLTFTIERHGGTVNGSTRAELQNWSIDISKWTAEIVSTKRRQLRPTRPRMDVSHSAKEIANAILSNIDTPSLKKYPDGRVKVLIGKIIPDDGFKQTISGRRRRFRDLLESYLTIHDWQPVSNNTYQLKPKEE